MLPPPASLLELCLDLAYHGHGGGGVAVALAHQPHHPPGGAHHLRDQIQEREYCQARAQISTAPIISCEVYKPQSEVGVVFGIWCSNCKVRYRLGSA